MQLFTIYINPREVVVKEDLVPSHAVLRFAGGGAEFYVVSRTWRAEDFRRASYHAMLKMQEHGLHAGQLKSVDARGR